MPPNNTPLDPSRIIDVGMGFGPSKTLLSAVEMDLFTHLGGQSLTGEEIGARLRLHPRAVHDFLDGLVAMNILERDGEGPQGRYRNSAEATAFLDQNRPGYVGGFLKMANARLYPLWADLTEALRTGQPQNETKHTGRSLFEEIYSDPERLEEFAQAMSGMTAARAQALAEKFDFSPYQTLCDVGGCMGILSMTLATGYPHLHCTTYDLPDLAPIAQKTIDAAGLADRIIVASGDFLADPLPRADVITMSHVLHDWNLDRKKQLIEAAYDALPAGGAFIIIETLIDNARRKNLFGLMTSLTMLIELGDAFDFTGSQFTQWCQETGFRDVEIVPLIGPASAGIAHKSVHHDAGPVKEA
jgi:predicted O-methyltransferase YrrM